MVTGIGRWCDGHGEHGPAVTKRFYIPVSRSVHKDGEIIRMLCPECFWDEEWQEQLEVLAEKNNLEEVRQEWKSADPKPQVVCSECGCVLTPGMSYRTMPVILCNDCFGENPR